MAASAEGKWGGRRHGKSVEEHVRDGTFRPDRHDPDWQPKQKPIAIADPVEYVAERIGLSPRAAALRPDLAERFEVVSAGEHLHRFGLHFCKHTRAVPEGPPLGSPFGLEMYQRAFFDEALSVDEYGHRIFGFAVLLIPRKCGKTTGSSLASLYMASPADGEHRPEVILAAGFLKQTGKLWDNASAFITDPRYGSEELRKLFLAQANAILCPSVGGRIERVAGDGDSNHSLDPHVVVCDELHVWRTPKQRENWRALTTAQGGRTDPLILAISTEGDGDDNELAQLLERIEADEATERERRTPQLTVYRNRDAGELVFKYAIGSKATLADLDEFVGANPASWRTRERIARDLAGRRVDDQTKLRLYGNRRGGGAGRWISDERWEESYSLDEIPEGAPIVVGVDGARTRDTTAVGWAWLRDDGRVLVRSRVWSTRDDAPHDVYVPGRLDNNLARDFIRDVLMEEHETSLLFYDERYFSTQADDLSADGMTVVEMHQGKPEMNAAWDEFYEAVHEGLVPRVLHNGDRVLRAHVQAAGGVKTERGWKVSKIERKGPREKPIDALAAVVMARYGTVHFSDFRKPKHYILGF
jgi:phage terminase large subunit-like protein